jgi:two-component system, NarL family, sensor kinase
VATDPTAERHGSASVGASRTAVPPRDAETPREPPARVTVSRPAGPAGEDRLIRSRLVALLERAVDASGDERRRIAATLQDGPVQELAAASFTLAGASATAHAAGQRDLARDLDAAAAAVRGSIRSLRTLLVDIHPASPARSGVVAALHELAQAVRRLDLQVLVDTDTEDELALGVEAQRLVHRVAQECLSNTARHAGATTATVSLRREGEGEVALDIVDDGRGFDVVSAPSARAPGHVGTGLLSDVTTVPGALLRVSSAPGRGTHWRLVLDDSPGGHV